jgi:repressor of nif and glnA expression
VEGSGNLANFVKFRKALGGISGVEGIQVKDMKPNETTLWVTYKGAASDLGAALMQQSFDAFTLAVAEAGEGVLRVSMSPK